MKTLISSNIVGNQQIDKILTNLNEDLSVNYLNQRQEFLALYEEEFATHFKPQGKMIHVFNRKGILKVFYFFSSRFLFFLCPEPN